MGFLDWFKRRREAPCSVVVDDIGVTLHCPGMINTIAWSDLREVDVLTTHEGSWVEDVFFALIGSGAAGLLVPQGSNGSDVLVAHLLKLPGFNESLFIEAMGSTANRKFVCWSRAA